MGINDQRGFNFMFSIFPILFCIAFILIIGGIIAIVAVSIARNRKNNQSPVLTVDAVVVSKRIDVTHHHQGGAADDMNYMGSTTWYYVTFQVDSGSRFELPVSGEDFGMLTEGDRGKLTFQGTRYLGFQRIMNGLN